MGKLKIVERAIFRGIDWHDKYFLTQYLHGEKGYDVTGEDCMAIIANAVKEQLSETQFPSLKAMIDNIRNGISFVERYEDSNGYVEVALEDGIVRVDSDSSGFSHNEDYHVIDIDNPVYVAVEEFYAPFKGAFTIQRTYWPPFGTYEEAEKALEKIPKRPSHFKTGKVVLIFDRSDFEPNGHSEHWLKVNLQDVELRKENPDLPFSPTVIKGE